VGLGVYFVPFLVQVYFLLTEVECLAPVSQVFEAHAKHLLVKLAADRYIGDGKKKVVRLLKLHEAWFVNKYINRGQALAAALLLGRLGQPLPIAMPK
jgi:hypothetical protein